VRIANALLHQENRERDGEGRIVAAVEDYELVRTLIGELVAEGVGARVGGSIRETVEAARTLLDDGRTSVTPKQLEGALRVGRSATYDRIHNAVKAGYLVDESSKDERGMRIVLGAALPGDADSYLPTAAEVVRAMSGGHPDNENPHGGTRSVALSGSPACPDNTWEEGEQVPFEGVRST
jgi:hypothetical protein